jgi:hypothetical protein
MEMERRLRAIRTAAILALKCAFYGTVDKQDGQEYYNFEVVSSS